MIQTLFLLSPTGEVLIERHFRGVVTPRSVCDTFWDRASQSVNHHGGLSTTTSILLQDDHYDSITPVMEISSTTGSLLYVISILRDGLSYLAVCPAEVSPLLILEFLHRIADTLVDYFGNPADESTIKENFSTVYQLLEEMMDYGWPLTTEGNALKAMIRPPTVMSKLLATSTSAVSDELPSGTVSNMPWRAAGVHYNQNEIYMDIIEAVDAIVDASGRLVSVDVSGSIQCQSHLSGIPDLLLTFKDPSLIDDCSFHPCVRYARYEHDHVVSFVPPDGNFELMRYRIKRDSVANFTPPIYCHVQWNVASTNEGNDPDDSSKGRIVLQMGLTPSSSLILSASRNKSQALIVEDVAITIPFPKSVRSIANSCSASVGSLIYDEAGKVVQWNLGKLDVTKKPQLTGQFTLNTTSDTATTSMTMAPNLSMSWKIPLASVSGLSVSGLSVQGEKYRPYKGVRNITKSGMFQVRVG
ncbi:AP-3 complex subunit mu [Seminavis robusta]|uniref:AP-3 complex subunit mu n=1 Tax=Seminavis robusta TaxID=568900 RepID=A0A9N8DBS7_9STRA|nr:AP-3 complex subunit mu [Seminavis robusta]|eukprot:Sro72_g040000.1 AP-3 complex subunit mu (470) ;mRNA; r:94451-95860